MMIADIAQTLQSWLEQKTGDVIEIEEPYAASGKVDSFTVFELIGFAESTFGIRFSSADFESSEFATLAGMARLIEAKNSR